MAVAAMLPTPLELPAAGSGRLHLGALRQPPPHAKKLLPEPS